MKSELTDHKLNDQDSRWPTSEMLAYGTFGTPTPAEKRLKLRNRILAAVWLTWLIVWAWGGRHPIPMMDSISAFLPAAFCTYYAWEKRKYFLSLDELTQRIELEGMAWAYSLGVLAALWVGGLVYAASLRWTLNSKVVSWMPFFLFAIFLATIKGTYRFFATRRY
jgi:hypothetical protein